MNRPDMLKLALNSALAQTYQNIEILIFDNSDNNASEKLVKTIDDARIIYKRHPQNIGQVGNYNALLGAAKADYIKFLNDDDMLDSNCVQCFVDALNEHSDVGIVTCRAAYYNDVGKRIKEDKKINIASDETYFEAQLVPELVFEGKLSFRTPSHTLYNKALALELGGFDQRSKYVFDVLLAYRMAKIKGCLFIEQEPLVRYLRHSEQVAANIAVEQKVDEQIQMFDFIFTDIKSSHDEKKLEDLKAYIFTLEIALALRSGNLKFVSKVYERMKKEKLSVAVGTLELFRRKVL